ncbi:MAG: homoserine kinase [Pseudomonadota bacterium]
MAVYTHVSREELEAFLSAYDLPPLATYHGIEAGVENSNYLLETEGGKYILTLFEKRVSEDDLPYFMALKDHLRAKGLNVPAPVPTRAGSALSSLCGKPAAILTFLEGTSENEASVARARAAGELLARLHQAADGYKPDRVNDLGPVAWVEMTQHLGPALDDITPKLFEDLTTEAAELQKRWPANLPRGAIHADFFPDNVMFKEDRATGVFDFYFACTDFFAYDLAIAMNAFTPEDTHSPAQGRALREGYETVRPLSPAEKDALPLFLRGSSLRFVLTRAHDYLNQVPGSLVQIKDPAPWLALNRAHRHDQPFFVTGSDMIEIYTDGACSGNPGPGGWGVLIKESGKERRLSGGAPATTNNRMELMGAIEALKAFPEGTALTLYTDSTYVKNGINSWIAGWKRNGWKTASRKPVKNQDLWETLDSLTSSRAVTWKWVKGHAGDPGNEEADRLAREGLKSVC